MAAQAENFKAKREFELDPSKPAKGRASEVNLVNSSSWRGSVHGLANGTVALAPIPLGDRASRASAQQLRLAQPRRLQESGNGREVVQVWVVADVPPVPQRAASGDLKQVAPPTVKRCGLCQRGVKVPPPGTFRSLCELCRARLLRPCASWTSTSALIRRSLTATGSTPR